MDKKKVIDNLKQVEFYINKLQGLDYTQLQLLKSAIFRLHDAQGELKKPDCISVEDELPPYKESVYVCNKRNPDDVWVTVRESAFHKNNNFILQNMVVTHWCKIDKLEV